MAVKAIRPAVESGSVLPPRPQRRFFPLTLTITIACATVALPAVTQPAVGATTRSAQSASASASTSACPSSGGVAVPYAKRPAASEVVIYGHGWGHGMGMSQYGAQGAARLGCSYVTILKKYYQGSKVVTRSLGAPVRLSLDGSSQRSTVRAEGGSVSWHGGQATSRQPQGTTWSVTRVTLGDKRGVALVDDAGKRRLWVAQGSTLTAPHAGRSVRLRSYHGSSWAAVDLRLRQGTLRFTRGTSRIGVKEQITGDATNTAVQKYLWGLGEVPVSWPGQALRAQVVAARTFLAGKYNSSAGQYRIGVTTSDQVYRGAAGEDNDARYGSHWKAAVGGTKGVLLVDRDGRLITTMYSSSMGGHTEDRAFVYGSQGGFEYLTGVDDSRWDAASSNPYRSWAKGYSKASFAKALGFSSVSRASVGARGSAARDQGVLITGVKDGRTVTKRYTGAAFKSVFGLRSTGFTIFFGIGGRYAQPLVGDWDGDGRADTGWYRNPMISLRTATGVRTSYRFDVPGAKAVVGDFDGNGRDSIALYKSGRWHIRNGRSTTARTTLVTFGRATDLPIAGHWSASKADGIGLVRGKTWIVRSGVGPGSRYFDWGSAAGRPVVGDWDGDGIDAPGRRSGSTWVLGKNAPTTGTGSVTAPGVLKQVTFSVATDRVTAGTARGADGSRPTVVRGTTFRWRKALDRTTVLSVSFRG
jgi:stage II sporulation protein D